MMSSRKEEERNEKIIRGLMKLPPNRRCINCNNLGPQYVCTNFWTFICISCSGIHREFTHRVKSVSLAKFTTQEVEALQKGGNQRAREYFLRDWDMQNQRLPNSSNADKVREFIKMVYVEKKYAKGMSSEKPPRDMQNDRNFEEDNRKASSYHSYSQSPPYDHQYEDRRYGKQSGLRTRRTGSDRLYYDGKLPSIIYSPGHAGVRAYEDRFANESSGPRFSGFSVSSAGETFRYDTHSPNSQKDAGCTSPLQPLSGIFIEDANGTSEASTVPHSQRTASSGSFGSSNSTSLRSVGSASLIDVVLQGEPLAGTRQAEAAKPSSAEQSYAHAHAATQDLYGLPSVQPLASPPPQFNDLFAEINQPLSATSPQQNHIQASFPENEGWATFDIHHHAAPTIELKNASSAMPPRDEIPKVNFESSTNNSSQLQTEQSATGHNHVPWMIDQWGLPPEKANASMVPSNTQVWNAFDDLPENSAQTLIKSLPLKTTSQISADVPSTTSDPYTAVRLAEDSSKYDFQRTLNGIPLQNVPFDGSVAGKSTSSVVIPMMGGNALDRKSSNPFDLPYEFEFESDNAFLDVNVLQAALPNAPFPAPVLDNISQPLFPQNPILQFISPVPAGGSAYMGEHLSNSQDLSSQGHAASVGGNPFA